MTKSSDPHAKKEFWESRGRFGSSEVCNNHNKLNKANATSDVTNAITFKFHRDM